LSLTERCVGFILFDAPIPRYRSLQGRLKFNEFSRLSPVFVGAAFETAVLPPKFIGAGPNAVRQRIHIHMKPHCLMNGFAHISSSGSTFVQSKLRRKAP